MSSGFRDDPATNRLGAIATAPKLRGRVRLWPRYGQDAVGTFFRGADAVVFTSLYEGCPIALLEAVDSGCTVIAPSEGGCGEVMRELGLDRNLYPQGDVTALADRIARIRPKGARPWASLASSRYEYDAHYQKRWLSICAAALHQRESTTSTV